ncbi:MAG: glycosyltransferase family A protein [Bacteroidota bacterium]
MNLSIYQPFFNTVPDQLDEAQYSRLLRYFQLLDKVEKPVVSLVTPVFQAQDTLLAHIVALSHLKTIIPYELIFVENNANAESLGILNQLGAKVVSQPLQGITHARQKGMEAARGEIICSLDPDSLYDPYYIDRMVLPFFEDEKLVMCYSVSKSYESDFRLSQKMKLRNWLKVQVFKRKLSKGFQERIKYIRAVCIAFKKESFVGIGYAVDLPLVAGCDDGMLAMHLHRKGTFKYVAVDVYTALPPPREPGKPFPFCNERFLKKNDILQEAYEALKVND